MKRDIESSTRLLSRSKFEFLERNYTSAEYRNGVNFRFLSRKQSSLPGVTFVRNMGDEEFWQGNLWKFFRSPRFRFAPRALSTRSGMGTGFSLFLERKRLQRGWKKVLAKAARRWKFLRINWNGKGSFGRVKCFYTRQRHEISVPITIAIFLSYILCFSSYFCKMFKGMV